MLSTTLPEIKTLSPEAIAEIRNVPHFRNSHYKNWNLNSLLASYGYGYALQIQKYHPIDDTTIISDIGTGYGWFAFALAMLTPARIIALDFDARRVDAARAIGDILGVNHRIDWRVGALGTLPVADRETDIACCLEVVEHVDREPATMRDLSRTTRKTLLITTPNGALPVVFHDTALPFCHWLPLPLRDRYAKLLGRQNRQDNNLFWTPRRIAASLPEFHRVSRFFHYPSFSDWKEVSDWLAQHPIGDYERPLGIRQTYYQLAGLLGDNAHYVLPNLAAIWQRNADQSD